MLGRLFDLRASADHAREPFTTTGEAIAGILADATALVDRCEEVVATAQAVGTDEGDPSPDY